MGMLSRLFSRGGAPTARITTTAQTPFRINQPVVGFYCPDSSLMAEMEADKAVLGPLFAAARVGTREVPPCNVLFVYTRFDAAGSVPNSAARLRDFIKTAHAHIAIVASENRPEHLFKAVAPENDWPANIVLTIRRKDAVFASFFAKLFQAMRAGQSMLVAWVALAPQGPSQEQPDCPATMMLAEAGHVAFGRGDADRS